MVEQIFRYGRQCPVLYFVLGERVAIDFSWGVLREAEEGALDYGSSDLSMYLS
jgi:hypothetical protein